MWIKTLLSPWVAALLLQAVLVFVLVVKKMWERFPLFLAYSVSSFGFNLALYLIFHLSLSRHVYFRVYWTNEGVGILLGIAMVFEIFRELFTPYPALRKLATLVFQWALLLLTLLGGALSYFQPVGEQHALMASLMTLEEATRILELGLLLFLFIFASAFGLHWRQYVFGIALGLGIFVAAELVGIEMRVHFGTSALSIYNMVRTISFNSSLFIWIVYLLAPELAASPAEVPKRAQLEQWNKAIMELIYQ